MNKLERPDWGKLFAEALTSPGKLSEAYSVFHEYSLSNRILATIQLGMRGLPLAPIASFNKWKEQGRHVTKGEKAISLIMPLSIKSKAEGGMGEGDMADGSEVKAGKRGFTIFVLKRNWFSLDQTEGAEFAPEIRTPAWDGAKAMGILEIKEDHFSSLPGNCQGYAYGRHISINPLATFKHKTRFHELAHVVLGHTIKDDTRVDYEVLGADIQEAEAESVAYLLCCLLDLPGQPESRGYIQGWLNGRTLPEQSAKRIFGAAEHIMKAGQ